MITSSIFVRRFHSQKRFGELSSFSFISIAFARISAVFLIILCVYFPVNRFEPSLTVLGLPFSRIRFIASQWSST